MNSKDKPYGELGKMLDDLARERDVRGPYNIAHYVQSLSGYEASGQAVSQYMYGRSVPKREFIEAFAEAFELSPQERGGWRGCTLTTLGPSKKGSRSWSSRGRRMGS